MSWGEKFKARLKFFAIAMAVMCPGFLIWMAPQTKRQVDSYNWPAVSGVVESITAKTSQNDKKETLYFGRVVYQYTVDGHGYTSDLTDLGPGSKRANERDALADVIKYRAGREVKVYYDPNDPSVAVIENGIPQNHLILIVILIIGAVVSLIASFFIVRSWLRALHAPKAAT